MTDATPAPSRLLTVAEAMAQLGIGKVKIYELMGAGELPYIKLPPYTKQAGRRVEQAEIDAFIGRHRQAAAASPA